MGILDSINHLMNFVLPALAVGLILPLLTRFMAMGRQARPGFWWQGLVNAIAGVMVLTGGLWFWGHDGKLAAYMAMVVACATSQWLMLGAWRR